jgi:hypothetical protein
MLAELHLLSVKKGEAITTIVRALVRGLLQYEKSGRRSCVTGEACFFPQLATAQKEGNHPPSP